MESRKDIGSTFCFSVQCKRPSDPSKASLIRRGSLKKSSTELYVDYRVLISCINIYIQ